jgi:hypothetical protein
MVRRDAQRILALGHDAEEEEQARHHPLEEREVLEPMTLGTNCTLSAPATRASVGTIASVRPDR